MPESLVVDADGSATVEAGVDPARETFELDPDELEQLRAELEAAGFDGFAQSTEPTGCADCYVYEVTYDGDDDLLRRVRVGAGPGQRGRRPPEPDHRRPLSGRRLRAAGRQLVRFGA